MTQNNLGAAYRNRLRGDRAANLERAIACFEAALQVRTQADTPQGWGMTQNNLGNAYHSRLRGDRGENLERAITCYEVALTVHTLTHTPHDWARIQNNLGTAYHERLRGDRAANQETAIACYEAALLVYTQADTPRDWAMTETNLGNAYRERLRGDQADNLERAIACYEAALLVYTPADAPHQWAMTQTNLSNAYRSRLHGDHADNLEQAIACCEAALRVHTQADAPHQWATAQTNLGNAYRSRLRGDRADNLERAIACCEAALRVRTQANDPHYWASTQITLGAAYSDRLRGDPADNLERAIACFEAALLVRTQADAPNDWAVTQNNLGAAYAKRLRGDRTENLERAIACYEAALPLLRLINPPHAVGALIKQGGAQLDLGLTARAHTIWQSALSLRETLLTAPTSLQSRGETARQSQDLVAHLALLELSLSDPLGAIMTLERGRALGLRQALSLDDVWLAGLPATARMPIIRAGTELEHLRITGLLSSANTHPSQVRAWEARIAGAALDLDTALATARVASGFSPPAALDAEALTALAPAGGALVELVAGSHGGAAIVLPAGCGMPTMANVVFLPNATSVQLRQRLAGWLGDTYRTIHRDNVLHPVEWLTTLLDANGVLEDVLDWLWQQIMEPMLAKAANFGVAPGSELVLLPQGDLALLPLHAAGPKADETNRIRRAVPR